MTAMTALGVLVPLSVAMGGAGLCAFFWSLRTRQYDDLKGAAERVLIDDEDEERPDEQKAAAGRSSKGRNLRRMQ